MDKRTKALLNGPDGPFDLADVSVSGNKVEMNVGEIGVDAGKFLIPVDVVDDETARCIEPEDGSEFAEDSGAGPICDWRDRAETEVAGDGVKETELLDKKKSMHRITLRCCSSMV